MDLLTSSALYVARAIPACQIPKTPSTNYTGKLYIFLEEKKSQWETPGTGCDTANALAFATKQTSHVYSHVRPRVFRCARKIHQRYVIGRTAAADIWSGLGFGVGLGSGWSGPTRKVEIDHTRRFGPTCT